MVSPPTIDLFAGPGGWDVAAAELGLAPVGLDISLDACTTGAAAGHARILADVTTTDPRELDELDGLIGSPPCQGFSTAGKSRGLGDASLLLAGIESVGRADDVDDVIVELAEKMTDARSVLTLEPLRWALHLHPRWIALEQVSAVLPIWAACALVLRRWGYSVTTGVVHAEAYGVPQSRRRAVLLARSRDLGAVRLPEPTHSRYYPRNPAQLDVGVQPWASMSGALGWSGGDLVGFPRRHDRGALVELGGVAYRGRDLRPASLPAQAVTEKTRSWARFSAGSRLPVELDQAAILQTFPADYPWAGNRTSQYRQIGDAVPPLLARALLAQVVT